MLGYVGVDWNCCLQVAKLIKQYVIKKYVDAVQWTGHNLDEIKLIDPDAEFLNRIGGGIEKEKIYSPNSSNYHILAIGSYILEDDRGDIWINSKDRFEAQHKEVEL